MKAEITEAIRNNTIPAVVGGRDVLCMNDAAIGHLVTDLHKLFKKQSEPEINSNTELIIDEVITNMNFVWGTGYKTSTESNRKFIRGRFNDGHTMEDITLVIGHLNAKWRNDPNMSMYLRPMTAFNAQKFEGYLQQAKRNKDIEASMILVRDSFGNKRRVNKQQFEAAKEGFFRKIEP